jgi:hypothetical protein
MMLEYHEFSPISLAICTNAPRKEIKMDIAEIISIAAGVVGGIAVIGGVLWKLLLPNIKETIASEMVSIREIAETNTQKIRDLTARVDDLDEKKVQDYESIKKQNEILQAILTALFVILDSVEDDPKHEENAKQAKQILRKHLIGGV